MARARKGSDSGGTGKGPPVGSVDNLHKRIESEQISSHIAAFEKSGGRVEKLGVTRMLHKIAPEPKPEARPKAGTEAAAEAKPASAGKPRGRPPKR